jgi:hypothetical protein
MIVILSALEVPDVAFFKGLEAQAYGSKKEESSAAILVWCLLCTRNDPSGS